MTMTLPSTPALECLHAELQEAWGAGTPSLEALGVLTRLADTLARSLFTLRTLTLRGFSNFKRSELRAYNEAHAFTLKKLFAHPSLPLDRVQLQVTDGLKVPYLEAHGVIRPLLDRLDITTVFDALQAYLAHYQDLRGEEFHTLTPATVDAHKRINRLDLKQVEAELRRVFGPLTRTHGPAIKYYPETKAVAATNQAYLACEPLFRQACDEQKRMQQIEQGFGALMPAINRLHHVDQSYAQALYHLIYAAAVQMDAYGVLLHELQRLEHGVVSDLAALSQQVL